MLLWIEALGDERCELSNYTLPLTRSFPCTSNRSAGLPLGSLKSMTTPVQRSAVCRLAFGPPPATIPWVVRKPTGGVKMLRQAVLLLRAHPPRRHTIIDMRRKTDLRRWLSYQNLGD